jgi:hypothetical protein
VAVTAVGGAEFIEAIECRVGQHGDRGLDLAVEQVEFPDARRPLFARWCGLVLPL